MLSNFLVLAQRYPVVFSQVQAGGMRTCACAEMAGGVALFLGGAGRGRRPLTHPNTAPPQAAHTHIHIHVPNTRTRLPQIHIAQTRRQ